MVYRVLMSCACILLASCASNPPLGAGGDGTVKVLSQTALPEPTRGDPFAASRPYLVGPFDKLTIDVFGIEDLSRKEVQTDASGRFSFPLAGIVEAAGKTPNEIESMLTTRLRASGIRDPQVTVNLRETVSQVITVDGQVREPGLYPVVGRMTLMRAVATAKGTSEYAKLEDVVVFRTVEGQRYAALYNLKAIRRGIYPDPEVFASDVVVVGDSPGRRLFKDILSIVPVITTPLIVALQRN